MAAWIGLSLMVGMMVGGGAVWLLGEGTRAELAVLRKMPQLIPPPRSEDGEMMSRVLDRLLSAVVPEPREESAADAPMTTHEAEYEPPDVEVGDWTDPFFGIERPVVARLAPGQAIPGMDPVDENHVDAVQMWQDKGEGAFDEWARETMAPGIGMGDEQVGSWVDPIGEV